MKKENDPKTMVKAYNMASAIKKKLSKGEGKDEKVDLLKLTKQLSERRKAVIAQ